jgi:type I restriction enzyme R subunit
MIKLTESQIEEFAIKLFQKLGYEYIYAPDIAPDSDNPVRHSFEDVVLKDKIERCCHQDK